MNISHIFLYFFRRCVFGVQNHLEDGCAWLGIADGPHLSHANEMLLLLLLEDGWNFAPFQLIRRRRIRRKKFVSF
jgi:hypothetical protein